MGNLQGRYYSWLLRVDEASFDGILESIVTFEYPIATASRSSPQLPDAERPHDQLHMPAGFKGLESETLIARKNALLRMIRESIPPYEMRSPRLDHVGYT